MHTGGSRAVSGSEGKQKGPGKQMGSEDQRKKLENCSKDGESWHIDGNRSRTGIKRTEEERKRMALQ